MRSAVLKSFLFGAAFGVGATILSLYRQRPVCFVDSVERIAEIGRLRRAKREEAEWEIEYLKEAGLSDEEIREVF